LHLEFIMKYFLLLLSIIVSFVSQAQDGKSGIHNFMVIDGDTIVVVNLPEVSIVERVIQDPVLVAKYNKLKRNALIVYPYGKEAIKLFVQMEDTLQLMKNKNAQKKYIKKMDNEMKMKFENKLKDLTKSQGYILIEMIERELNMSMNDVVKKYRGGFSAFYWNTFAKFYGYNLKNKYSSEDDPDLENILKTLDISYKSKYPKVN
jgi:hypothetical protein